MLLKSLSFLKPKGRIYINFVGEYFCDSLTEALHTRLRLYSHFYEVESLDSKTLSVDDPHFCVAGSRWRVGRKIKQVKNWFNRPPSLCFIVTLHPVCCQESDRGDGGVVYWLVIGDIAVYIVTSEKPSWHYILTLSVIFSSHPVQQLRVSVTCVWHLFPSCTDQAVKISRLLNW